ncbi:hypothetical protein [Falsiroseomonas selenitidurans]|uniref:Chemotaxis protein n=1 Tax=Falsiroseomonas selenitidurans TaxID=2716335 RepID=A0ABX1DZD6_9PROT|nr:hypothetical protein [Falsiroseomonas selenitidurans]NKC30211.1 hypothetical protein [Falsiroseomonas selenitidurans]
MTTAEATRGLPDWAKLFLPMLLTLLLGGTAWLVQWGEMRQARKQDQAAIASLQQQIGALVQRVDAYAASTLTITEQQRSDDRRLSGLESETAVARGASALIAAQIGEMRAILQGLRDETQMLRRALETRQRSALPMDPA